jgi:outer membrane protein TolC
MRIIPVLSSVWVLLPVFVCAQHKEGAALIPEAIGQGSKPSAANPSSAELQGAPTSAEAVAPITLTLEDALKRARANNPQFLSALADAKLAHEDSVQARATVLPSVSYITQYLYTQGNGTPSGRFIANNAVHEYVSQGNVHEVLLASGISGADFRRAAAAEALARAKADVAARGLVVTVVRSYYGLVVAQRKYATAQQALDHAKRFLTISQDLERGGEVAHSDVIKAQLQFNLAQRDFQEAQLAMEKARLDLAVLLFPNFNQSFTVVDDLSLTPALLSFSEVQAMAQRENPDLRAAMAAVRERGFEVSVARSGYLPSLAFDYFYGIDATHFATRTDGIRNLGYYATATLALPIWNWGATHSKVRQAELKREQSRAELNLAQRQLVSNLYAFYREADVARSEVDTLRDSAELAAESLRLTTLRYQSGEATVLEVVDAQNTLIQARNAYDDGQARYRVALANLQTLTGSF